MWTFWQLFIIFTTFAAVVWLAGLALQGALFLILYAVFDTSVWLFNKTIKLFKGER